MAHQSRSCLGGDLWWLALPDFAVHDIASRPSAQNALGWGTPQWEWRIQRKLMWATRRERDDWSWIERQGSTEHA